MLDQADEIWLVTDASIATLVSLDQALKHLAGQREREKRLQLVINRHDDSSGMSPEQIARRFEVPLLATLPERPRVRLAASQGHLLLQDAPRDPYLRALAPLVPRLDPAACPVQPHGLRKDSPLPWVDRNGRQGNSFPACRCPPGAARESAGTPAVRADRAVPEGAVGRARASAQQHRGRAHRHRFLGPDTIARWVQVQTVGFIQEWRIPINEEEMQVVAEGLVKELTGFGPLDDLLHDPSIEDILINGFRMCTFRRGQLKRATQRFTDDTHLLRILRRIRPAGPPAG